MKNKIKYLFFLAVTIEIFTSCVTETNIIKDGALCGIVVDENNKPVSNYLIYCFKNENNKLSTVTNDSGIFVFPDIEIGKYYIEGEKINFCDMEKQEYIFNDCTSLFCVQIMSFSECISNVDLLIEAGEFQKSLDLINSLSVKQKSNNETLLLCYSSYLNYALGNMKKSKNCLDELKKINNNYCSSFINTMEDIING